MCGIFGLILGQGTPARVGDVRAALDRLFLLSESRGKEAAGLALRAGGDLRLHKEAEPASKMIRGSAYRAFIAALGRPADPAPPLLAIGHSRLVTNGTQALPANNQPVAAGPLAGVHNGIIVNDEALWKRHPGIHRESGVDTEVLLKLLANYRDRGLAPAEACARAFAELEGSASIAVLDRAAPELLLATNAGSLYFAQSPLAAVFASERHILASALRHAPFPALLGTPAIRPVRAFTGLLIPADGTAFEFALPPPPAPEAVPAPAPAAAAPLPRIRRCARCILPETMPFIRFDAEGVCDRCREPAPPPLPGAGALERAVAPFRSRDGGPDCLVALSGGRDSCYGLHYLKTVLKMNPIAWTYDWGMVTDLARRNQARLCGRLGVEHILISADIARKRGNIRKNVEAWLRKPRLGLIPLFMAGDKQFFWHAHRLRRQTGIPLAVFCSNPLELTNFKTGFIGYRGAKTHSSTPLAAKLYLGFRYLSGFLGNPGYLNGSLWDTFLGYLSTYMLPHDFLNVYDYLPWDEKDVEETLIRRYGWELAKDTASTWRIGDGTASFYNHIYRTVAGFTEFDTMRSNQIRAGLMTRDEALRRIAWENQSRHESMREYARAVGFDLERALRVIDAMPKLYAPG